MPGFHRYAISFNKKNIGPVTVVPVFEMIFKNEKPVLDRVYIRLSEQHSSYVIMLSLKNLKDIVEFTKNCAADVKITHGELNKNN